MTEREAAQQPIRLDDVAAIDAARDPLCLLCRASFCEHGTSLCAACLYPEGRDRDAVPTPRRKPAA